MCVCVGSLVWISKTGFRGCLPRKERGIKVVRGRKPYKHRSSSSYIHRVPGTIVSFFASHRALMAVMMVGRRVRRTVQGRIHIGRG